jgi:hypothetical protein
MNTAENLNTANVKFNQFNNTQCEVIDCEVPELINISDICYRTDEIVEWCLLNPSDDHVYKFDSFTNNTSLIQNNSTFIAGSYPLKILLDYLHENYFDILRYSPDHCPLPKKSPFDFKWKSNNIDLFILNGKCESTNSIGDKLNIVSSTETSIDKLLTKFDLPVSRVAFDLQGNLHISIQAIFSIVKRKMNIPLSLKTNQLIQERVKKYSGRGFGVNWISTEKTHNSSISTQAKSQKTHNSSIPTQAKYWNSDMPVDIFNKLVDHICEMIRVASKYEGKTFGGFVRNVLVQRYLGLPVYGFKDVDLWFKSKEDANKFLQEMGSSMKLNNEFSSIGKEAYPFQKDQYFLIHEGLNPGVLVDVVVSAELPVNDFNVNQLTYDTTSGFKSYGTYSVEELMKHIREKKMVMLPTYLSSQKTQLQQSTCSARISAFNNKGWKIINFKQNGNLFPYTNVPIKL